MVLVVVIAEQLFTTTPSPTLSMEDGNTQTRVSGNTQDAIAEMARRNIPIILQGMGVCVVFE